MINSAILDNPDYNSFDIEKIFDKLEYIRCNSEQKVSIEKLANHLGLSASSYKRYLANEHEPFKKNINTIYRICQYTNHMLFQLAEDDFNDNPKLRIINKITNLSDSQLKRLEYYINTLEKDSESVVDNGLSIQRMLEANSIINSLYHKILFVDLTNDYFEAIQVSENESKLRSQIITSSKISEWFEWFSTSPLLHPDDISYFKTNVSIQKLKTAMRFNEHYSQIKYRRLSGSEYKQVALDVVRCPDYSSSNQTVLICVRDA